MKTEPRYTPQCSPSVGVPSLLDEAWRLGPFVPPFAFSAFFSPEDTLLCVCAADAARHLMYDSAVTLRSKQPGATWSGARLPVAPVGDGIYHIAELTSGSGLVGLYLLGRDCNATLLGLDIDSDARRVAEQNARALGLADRARFARSDLWSSSTLRLLEAGRPRMIVCNPPYVPEPPGTRMQVEAGAGPNGTAHLLRALELADRVQPEALALSWCSLSDPAGIVVAAESRGYELHTLFVTAIADGEYSGTVHFYLRGLADCFINEQRETLDIIAPDPSARFTYLLLAGAFHRRARNADDANLPLTEERGRGSAAPAVLKLCQDFAREGLPALAAASAPFSLHCSILNRWDELRLRVMLHGVVAPPLTLATPE